MTKLNVLKILRETNDYISGEKISSQLGVSRAAVNTAVKTLRKMGYKIHSVTNKGYLLQETPNNLSSVELSAYLSAERLHKIHCMESIGSTNNHLRELALHQAPNGTAVIANEQTNGHGRKGRNFLSPKDYGIYLSYLFRPKTLPADTTSITAWSAVAVIRAIEKICGICPNIKWVNDLIINQKKVCGILTEMSVEGESGQIQYILIGIGVNVNEENQDFPDSLRNIATSLSMETGKKICRAELAAEIINELDNLTQAWPFSKEEYLNSYRKYDITVGKELLIQQADCTKKGIATEITDTFSLLVQYGDDSLETLSSGEVSILNFYGNPPY